MSEPTTYGKDCAVPIWCTPMPYRGTYALPWRDSFLKGAMYSKVAGAVGFEPTLKLVRSECDFPVAETPIVK